MTRVPLSVPQRTVPMHTLPPVRVVGLGASAGGLAALESFLGGVPPGSGLALVVVQHLDPTRKALLVELLRRATPMPVTEATDGLRLQPDHVYVIPPDHDLTVVAGALRLSSPHQPRGLRLPIDRLFESLAADGGDTKQPHGQPVRHARRTGAVPQRLDEVETARMRLPGQPRAIALARLHSAPAHPPSLWRWHAVGARHDRCVSGEQLRLALAQCRLCGFERLQRYPELELSTR